MADHDRYYDLFLAVFEMLEEAACDSSFCSNSSAVKKLIDETQQKMSPQTTSTPKAQLPNGQTGRSKAGMGTNTIFHAFSLDEKVMLVA